MSARPTRLRSSFDPSTGTVSLELVAGEALPERWRLALTSIVQLAPTRDARLLRRLATYHELEPIDGGALAIGEPWRLGDLTVGHIPRHANDGPVSAFVIRPDGAVVPVDVEPMDRVGDQSVGAPTLAPTLAPTPTSARPDATFTADRPALLPYPRACAVHDPTPTHHRTAALAARSGSDGATGVEPGAIRAAWRSVADLSERVTGERRLVERPGVADGEATVTAVLATDLETDAYRCEIDDGRVHVEAGGTAGFRHAFVTLAQWLDVELPRRASIADRPTYAWRGLHIDLARQWFEPEVVDRLIDTLAWRKMSRLHLHLTDDEAWRIPVPEHPELAEIGARRGHGLPLPPMLGGGAPPAGRAYRRDEIARWVARADELGVVLVPELDLPAHLHAALTALPGLRDLDDDSGAVSVQFFTDNVLVPGLASTETFVAAAVAAVADLFPGSPWIHIGGDEVPPGAWSGSPAAERYRAERSLPPGTAAVEAAFHRDLVQHVQTEHGRAVGAWQEAAESGGVRPGDGYVVGWRSVEINRALAAAGHHVVVSPGQAYYLDMAVDEGWTTPGASWAGSTSLQDVCAFDPSVGWSDAERAHLSGVQACVWTEHVRTEAELVDRLFPRLDAVAERAWTGEIIGGAESIAARSVAIGGHGRPEAPTTTTG